MTRLATIISNKIATVVFFLFAVAFAAIGISDDVPTYIYVLHLLVAVMYPLSVYMYSKVNTSLMFVLILLYNVALSATLRYCFMEYDLGGIFGPATDSYAYDRLVIDVVFSGTNLYTYLETHWSYLNVDD